MKVFRVSFDTINNSCKKFWFENLPLNSFTLHNTLLHDTTRHEREREREREREHSLWFIKIMNTCSRSTSMRREGEETQSLLSSSSSTNTTTKKRNTNYYYYYVALGVVASAGILGTVSSKSSSSAAFPRGGIPTLGKDRPTIRLSVGCTPEDVLSLLPFEPKSWRGAVSFFFFLLIDQKRRDIIIARREILLFVERDRNRYEF